MLALSPVFMKIRLFLLTFLLTSVTCLAQKKYKHLYPGYYGNGSSSEPVGLRIGLRAGISQTDITKQLLVNPNLEDSYEPVFKPTLGFMAQYGLTRNFILGTGLNYRPMAINYKTSSSLETTITQTRTNYIELPLILNIAWRKGAYNPYPTVHGGITLAYLLNAKRDFESQSLNDNIESTSMLNMNVSENYNQLDYGVTAGISYYIPVQTYFQIMIDLTGYMGLANINNLPDDSINQPNTIHTAVSLSIGLIWGR